MVVVPLKYVCPFTLNSFVGVELFTPTLLFIESTYNTPESTVRSPDCVVVASVVVFKKVNAPNESDTGMYVVDDVVVAEYPIKY